VTNLPSPEERAGLGAAGVAAGLGCSIVVSVVLLVVGGVAIDNWLGTSPIFTLIGVALALLSAGYQLYELAELGQKGRERRIVTRTLARIPVRQAQDSGPAHPGPEDNHRDEE
jgi:putative F0F1-ATPase subunit (Ca2+/Mg2+ transporter)